MKHTMKKITAFLLALAMLINIMPVSVLADQGEIGPLRYGESGAEYHTVTVTTGRGISLPEDTYALFECGGYLASAMIGKVSSGETVTVNSPTVFFNPYNGSAPTKNYTELEGALSVRVAVNESALLFDENNPAYHLYSQDANYNGMWTISETQKYYLTNDPAHKAIITILDDDHTEFIIGQKPEYAFALNVTPAVDDNHTFGSDTYYIVGKRPGSDSYDYYVPINSDGTLGAIYGKDGNTIQNTPKLESVAIIKYDGTPSLDS